MAGGKRPFSALRAYASGGKATPTPPVDPDQLPGPLREMTQRARARPGEVCGMCGEDIADEHAHVADVVERRLLCTCRACYLLFTGDGQAGGGHFVAVPEEYAYRPDFALTTAQWESLQIPVDLVFFFTQTQPPDEPEERKVVAFYPSPAGATESLLDLDVWAQVLAANPELGGLAPDTQAALVRRQDAAFACYLVPIDACYELVGIVRTHWHGFHGGEEVWRLIDAFFARLRERAGAR